jgi:hypothetical protein
MPQSESFEFDCAVLVDGLLWISSLHADEKGSARRAIEDLEPLLYNQNLRLDHVEVTSARQLQVLLTAVRSQAAQGRRPIIHIDMHGSAERGLLIAATGEYVPWNVLLDDFRRINIAMENNLVVISMACHSFLSILQITPLAHSPFFILIAPQSEITIGAVSDRIIPFYEAFFVGTRSVYQACDELFGDAVKLFHAERYLLTAILRYYRQECSGARLSRRIDTLLGKIPQRMDAQQRRHYRREAKRHFRSIDYIFERIVPTVLGLRPPSATPAQVSDMVRALHFENERKLVRERKLRKTASRRRQGGRRLKL